LPLRAVDVGDEVDEVPCVNCERDLGEITSDPVIDPSRD